MEIDAMSTQGKYNLAAIAIVSMFALGVMYLVLAHLLVLLLKKISRARTPSEVVKRIRERAATAMRDAKGDGKRISKILRPYLVPFLQITALTVIIQALVLLFPYLVGQAAGCLQAGGKGLRWYILAIATVTSAGAYLSNVRWLRYYHYIDEQLEKDIKLAGFGKAESMSLGQTEGDTEKIRQTVTAGDTAIRNSLHSVVFLLQPALIGLAFVIIGFFVIKAKIGFTMVGGFFLYAFVSLGVNWVFLPKIRRFAEKERDFDSKFGRKLCNIVLVILANQRESEVAKYASGHRECRVIGRSLWGTYLHLMGLLREPICLVFLWIACDLTAGYVLQGEIAPEKFPLVMWWSIGAIASMAGITHAQRDLMSNWENSSKHLDFLDTPARVLQRPDPVKPLAFTGIKVSKAYFKHPDASHEAKWALEDVSIEVGPGDIVLFVGESGSGKTSLLKLILGAFYCDEGEVEVSGVSMRVIDHTWWRSCFGYISQRPMLWDVSMRDNILYGKADVSEARLIEAMKAVKLYDKFYVTGRINDNVGENGCCLSGGEAKRVEIARAIIGRPKVLLFDEPTTGLDTESENHVLETIFDLADERDHNDKRKYTVVMVTHELMSAPYADTVVVFKDGKIAGKDSHFNLLRQEKTCPAYESLMFRKPLRLKRPRLVDQVRHVKSPVKAQIGEESVV